MKELLDRRIWHKDFGLCYWCSICGEYKPEELFYKNNRTKWGVDRMCKDHYRKVNKEEFEGEHLKFNNLTRTDIKATQLLLQSLGYDTSQDIHTQFMERHKDKLNQIKKENGNKNKKMGKRTDP